MTLLGDKTSTYLLRDTFQPITYSNLYFPFRAPTIVCHCMFIVWLLIVSSLSPLALSGFSCSDWNVVDAQKFFWMDRSDKLGNDSANSLSLNEVPAGTLSTHWIWAQELPEKPFPVHSVLGHQLRERKNGKTKFFYRGCHGSAFHRAMIPKSASL